MLAAGLNGIENGYELPPPAEFNLRTSTDEERRALGIEMLPDNLGEALRLTEESDLVREALGEHVFQSFIRNKRLEWDQYRTRVTDYEIERYLTML